MNWRNVNLIFRREVLDQVRDRRTLFMVVVLPLLLYPLLGVGTTQMTAMFAEQPRTVVILGAADLPTEPPLLEGNRFASPWFRSPADGDKLSVLTDGIPPTNADGQTSSHPEGGDSTLLNDARKLRESITERKGLEGELALARKQDATAEITRLENSLERLNQQLTSQFDQSPFQLLIIIPPEFAQQVRQRGAQLAQRVTAATPPLESSRPLMILNSAEEKSVIAYHRVRDVLRAWERATLKEQLHQSELPTDLMTPINVAELDLAKQEQISANLWSRMLPALLVIMTLTGAFYPAVDLCAGEKERGTMETLLICPASRTEIVLGKFLTVLLFSMLTAVLNLLSIGMTGKYMASLALGGASSKLGELALPPFASLLWVIVILIPLATLFSALCLALATFARSSKEGQYYLTPLLMVALGLMMFCLSPGVEMQPFYSVMPVIGPGLLLKGILKSTGPDSGILLFAIPVLTTSIGYSLLALWWAIEQFGSEEVLFCESEQWDLRLWIKQLIHEKGPIPTFSAASFCFLLIILLQFGTWKPFQTILQTSSVVNRGLLQIQLLMLQQVVTIALPALAMGLLFTSRFRQTFSLRWPGFVCMLFAVLLAITLHPLIFESLVALQWFFPPVPSGIAELMNEFKTINLGLAILAIAVTPAICEEIAFRGFLLSGFARKGHLTAAVLLSGFAFGVIHMIPQQVFSAMLLGFLLGILCLRTRSLLPGNAFHFVHNSLSLLHDRFGDCLPAADPWGYFCRFEETALRYQPATLLIAGILSLGLLYRLIQPNGKAVARDEVR